MRDYFLESALKSKLVNENIGEPGTHDYGWSWVGGCMGSHLLSKEHPEVIQKKGNMYPGSAGHHFWQSYIFVPGNNIAGLLVLGHEQQTFVYLESGRFFMSPQDTRVLDVSTGKFGVIDYKIVKDLNWVEENAKDDNREQVNLYAYKSNASFYILIYVEKLNYDHFKIHRYEMDSIQGKKTVERLEFVDKYLHEDGFKDDVLWTSIAEGLSKWTNGNKPYRFICEPSTKTPSYRGCPYKKWCLENLSKECGEEFTSLFRYDHWLESD